MADNKETGPKKGPSLNISDAFLEGTLFLLFGPKSSQKSKRQIPPVYIVFGIIIFLIFALVIKKVTRKPKDYYTPGPYPYERAPQPPFRPGQMPPGGY